MCNANNHSSACTCGFGGEGYLGRSTGRLNLSNAILQRADSRNASDFCRPSICPECRAPVFFVRHNGGSVWFDELGWPWPKHGCFDEDQHAQSLRSVLTKGDEPRHKTAFGVVVEAVATRLGAGGRIKIDCSDGNVIDEEFDTTAIFIYLVGRLVVVHHEDAGRVRLRFVETSFDPLRRWQTIFEYASKPGFPHNVGNHTVVLNSQIGRVIQVLGDGKKFKFRISGTGEIKLFQTSYLAYKAKFALNKAIRESKVWLDSDDAYSL